MGDVFSDAVLFFGVPSGLIAMVALVLIVTVAVLISRRGLSTPEPMLKKKATPKQEEIPKEIVAVITAAVAATLSKEQPDKRFVIASITRADGHLDPWSMAGKQQNTKSI